MRLSTKMLGIALLGFGALSANATELMVAHLGPFTPISVS